MIVINIEHGFCIKFHILLNFPYFFLLLRFGDARNLFFQPKYFSGTSVLLFVSPQNKRRWLSGQWDCFDFGIVEKQLVLIVIWCVRFNKFNRYHSLTTWIFISAKGVKNAQAKKMKNKNSNVRLKPMNRNQDADIFIYVFFCSFISFCLFIIWHDGIFMDSFRLWFFLHSGY